MQRCLTARLRDAMGSAELAEALIATYHDQATAAGLSPASDAYWTEAEATIAREVEVRLARRGVA
jgi:hypothetical protein